MKTLKNTNFSISVLMTATLIIFSSNLSASSNQVSCARSTASQDIEAELNLKLAPLLDSANMKASDIETMFGKSKIVTTITKYKNFNCEETYKELQVDIDSKTVLFKNIAQTTLVGDCKLAAAPKTDLKGSIQDTSKSVEDTEGAECFSKHKIEGDLLTYQCYGGARIEINLSKKTMASYYSDDNYDVTTIVESTTINESELAKMLNEAVRKNNQPTAASENPFNNSNPVLH